MRLLKKESSRSRGVEKRRLVRLSVLTLVAALVASFSGCKAMNESPKNERFWFPTLAPPTQKEQEMRRRYYPEGADPFVDATVGPRSFDTRPRGWQDQRSKTSDVFGTYPDVYYD